MMDKTSRQALNVAVAGLLSELGFQYSEKMAHETLTEIMQSLLCQIGLSAHSYCELSCRTESVIGDVVLALVNMGLSVEGIDLYARRPGRVLIPAPSKLTQPKQQCILHCGRKQPHPPHIPAHFPVFPDPHAYIRTPTYKQPETEYETLREKASIQKRCIERALTKYVAKIGEKHSLFVNEDKVFPLVTCGFDRPPYLKALLATTLHAEIEDLFLPCSNPGCQMAYRKWYSDLEETEEGGKGELAEVIDNPYLRPPKIPSERKRKFKKKCHKD